MPRSSFRRAGFVTTAIGRAVSGVARFLFRSHFVVRGDSMSPTLRDGDLIHVAPRLRKPASYKRGSVIVAQVPGWGEQHQLIISVKRVVGLPGEYCHVGTDGTVRVEEEFLHDTFVAPGAQAVPSSGLSWLCEYNEYFLMGDNRRDSGDSRRFGPVPASQLLGRVWLRLPTHYLPGRRPPGSARKAH